MKNKWERSGKPARERETETEGSGEKGRELDKKYNQALRCDPIQRTQTVGSCGPCPDRPPGY